MKPFRFLLIFSSISVLIISAMISTNQKTSITPYSLTAAINDPQHHYTFYKGDSNSRFDYVKNGYWHITDTEIIYLARRNRFDSSKLKLIKYDILTDTFGKFVFMIINISPHRNYPIIYCYFSIYELIKKKFLRY